MNECQCFRAKAGHESGQRFMAKMLMKFLCGVGLKALHKSMNVSDVELGKFVDACIS